MSSAARSACIGLLLSSCLVLVRQANVALVHVLRHCTREHLKTDVFMSDHCFSGSSHKGSHSQVF